MASGGLTAASEEQTRNHQQQGQNNENMPLNEFMGSLSIEDERKCNHGRPLYDSNNIVDRLMKAFENALEKVINDPDTSFDAHFLVMDRLKEEEIMCKVDLFSLGFIKRTEKSC